METDIFTRELAGEGISPQDPEYHRIAEIQKQTRRLLVKLNSVFHDENETRAILSELTGCDIDDSVEVLLPFYTDFGRNIRFGRRVFVNANAFFMDRGGIVIEEGAFIGPNVSLITMNHDERPEKRSIMYSRSIHICRNVWIGAGATVLPCVTVGEGAIIAAAAVVTKDVPPMSIVAGNPAKKLRNIHQ